VRRLLRWLNRRLGIVATGAENDYLAWADTRLDELAAEARAAAERRRVAS
jgi:hypothetical protein